jgi:hypothetical protein
VGTTRAGDAASGKGGARLARSRLSAVVRMVPRDATFGKRALHLRVRERTMAASASRMCCFGAGLTPTERSSADHTRLVLTT